MKFRAGFAVKLCFSLLSDLMNLEIFGSSCISVNLSNQLVTVICDQVLKD